MIFSLVYFLPDGGGETTKSPKLTESDSSSNRKVAEFHTKLYLSLTCSKTDLFEVGDEGLLLQRERNSNLSAIVTVKIPVPK